MRCLRNLVLASLFLTLILPSQTTEQKLKTLLQQYKTALDKKAGADAVLACAAAVKLAPADKDAQACASSLKTPDQINAVAKSGTAFLGAGDLQTASDLCGAALVLNPLDKDAAECGKSARTRIVALGQDQSKLEQARGFVAAGDSARAAAAIAELQKSESSDIVTNALSLQQKLNEQSAALSIAKQRAGLRQAELQIADGKRDAAAQTLKEVIASTNDPAIAHAAEQLLARSRTSWGTVFAESLRAAWIMQFLAALFMTSAAWVLLHWIRDFWRLGDAHVARRLWRKSAKWTFTGIEEDKGLGARDPILDALRRVPNEVRMPVWTPTRLLLYPGNAGWEVWEDFAVEKSQKAREIHEPTFEKFLQAGNDDKILADAFQNVQLSLGSVNLTGITKFWAGLVDWWHAGEPSFSASARMIDADDGKAKLVAVRISASGPTGMFSAFAVTKSKAECDAISQSAERAAYKLLFRMNDERRLANAASLAAGASPKEKDDEQKQAQTASKQLEKHNQLAEMQREVTDADRQAKDADQRAADAATPLFAEKEAIAAQDKQVQKTQLKEKEKKAQEAAIAHRRAATAYIHAAAAHEAVAAAHMPAQQAQETVQQIDAHAAFRQGATALAGYVRSVNDNTADEDRRREVLRDAVENLEFVHHTFNRDKDHHVYYVEALRFQAIAYALLGREQAALGVLELLEDATTGASNTPRDRQLQVEAIYNQAILHWKRAGDNIPSAASEATMCNYLWDRIAETDSELLHAEKVWQLAQLANMPRANWLAVDPTKAQTILDGSLTLAKNLQVRAKCASGAERRYCLMLEQNLHRYYAIAQLRMIATFKLPGRAPFDTGAAVSNDIADLVDLSLQCFEKSDTIGPASFNGLVMRAYGALLLSRFAVAEELAKQAIEKDAKDQYARYIAAEAALQRKDQETARQYLAGLIRIEEQALRDLAALLAPLPADNRTTRNDGRGDGAHNSASAAVI